MTINKSLFSSLPQFPTLRLGSCLHEPFISSLHFGSCPHKPITHIPWFVFSRTIYFFSTLWFVSSQTNYHITWFVSSRTNYPYPMVRVSTNHLHTPHSPWFMFLQTNYSLHTPWFVSSLRLGSCPHEPINLII